MRTKFKDIEVAVNERMKKIFDRLNEQDKNFPSKPFEYKVECIEDSNEADMSTQVLLKAYHKIHPKVINNEKFTASI